jgi:hypothetical protein
VFLLLPRWNPQLEGEITVGIPRWLLFGSAIVSALMMGSMIVVQIVQDLATLRSQTLTERIANHSLTSLELALVWGAVGAGLYALANLQRSKVEAPFV